MIRLQILSYENKKNPPHCFLQLAILAAFLLFLTAGMLTLFAFAGAQQPDNNTQTIRSARLADAAGIYPRDSVTSTTRWRGQTGHIPAERPPGANSTARTPLYRTDAQSSPGHAGAHWQVTQHAADRCGDGQQSLSSGTDSSQDSNAKWRPSRSVPNHCGTGGFGAGSDRRQLRGYRPRFRRISRWR